MPQPRERDFALFEDLNTGVRVRLAATGNVTIATGLVPGQTVDGNVVAKGDFILLPAQTAPAENGIWVSDTVPFRLEPFSDQERNKDAAYARHGGQLIVVMGGTANADSVWLCTNSRVGTLGTTALTFTKLVVTATAVQEAMTEAWEARLAAIEADVAEIKLYLAL